MDHGSGDQRKRRLRKKLNDERQFWLRAGAQSVRRQPTHLLLLAVVVPAVMLFGACAKRSDTGEQPLAAVSLAPLAYVVDRLAEGLVRAETVVPPAASAHTFEPSMEELHTIAAARIYVRLGHPNFTFERAWLDDLIRDRPDLKIVEAARGLAWDPADPHVWLSPRLMRRIAANVTEGLARAFPAHAALIRANLERLDAEVSALDRDIRRIFQGRSGRRFFVFHPAWGYFARDYGLVQVAVERAGREPDPHTLASVIEQARRARVRVLFVQPQHSEASARLVADEIGAHIEVIDPMAYDWQSNLRKAAEKIARGLVE